MPTRKTHLLFAVLLFLLLQQALRLPAALALFALAGALAPDLDLRFMHRKLLHNMWALLIFAWAGISSGLLFMPQAVAFAIGWVSHLVADSLTHTGVMPLWPIPAPRFKGAIRTGGAGELALMLGLLVAIGVALGIVKVF
ncbi:MAG: metal-dependent hydrolase [Candidatus Aenigmatarchaeota archaeon]